jgi:DNA-binding beta-propeller fold protein YncE
VGDDLYLVCQNIKSLVRINRKKNSFRLIEDKEKTLRYPIALCRGVEDEIFLSDTETATIYRLRGGRLEPFIRSGLNRPTGIAFNQNTKRLYVVDTGEHRVHIFDLNGEKLGSFPESNDTSAQLNYPIAVAVTASGSMVVNDALNFKIKRFSASGLLESVFGFEGDVPGAFARPKGIALDSDGHVYVVDNLFDNFQVFDAQGATLLAVGSAGQESGEFWSPGGIDIVADTLYIADTYNNRVQLFTYLGDER